MEPEGAKEWNDFAYYYDLYYDLAEIDQSFYLEIAKRAGPEASILELACGAGRILLPLARSGYKVSGLDYSPGMLEVCREKLEGELAEVRERLDLYQGDMRDLEQTVGNQRFEVIILGFNSFRLLLSRQDQLACLKSTRQILKPGGTFVIAVVSPEVDPDNPAKNRMEFWGNFKNPRRNSSVTLMVSTTDYPERQEQRLKYYVYDKLPDGTTEVRVSPITMRYFYREKLQALLEEAGFKVEKLYGSYNFEDFTPQSHRIIFVCRPG